VWPSASKPAAIAKTLPEVHVPNYRLRLEALGASQHGQTWEAEDKTHVGRAGTCKVDLADASVSRQHAELLCTPSGWVVRDLGSRNGTFVNGARVGRIEQKLRQNDVLQFGDVCVLVAAIGSDQPAAGQDLSERWQIGGKANQTWTEVSKLISASGLNQAGKNLSLMLAQAGRLSYHGQTFNSYLESLLWEVAENLNAGACAIWLRDDKTEFLTRQAAMDVAGQPVETIESGRSMAEQALQQGESLFWRERPPHQGTVVCAVLRTSSSRQGILQVTSAPHQPFDQADLNLADALALALAGGIESVRRLYEREQLMLLECIAALTKLVGLRDHQHEAHAQRVTDYALLLAEELQLPDQDRFYLRIGGTLHELAKLGFKDAVLHKRGALDAQEMQHVRSCVLKAAALLESSQSLVPLVPIVRSHHEQWDGKGYPDGLAGERIPLLGRIIALADAFDAMTSDQSYRRALTLDQAYAEIQSKSGSQFDPGCVNAWLRLRPRLEELFGQRLESSRTFSLEALRQSFGTKAASSSASNPSCFAG
jgi:HD-GYP domain-containing protein (c-di-GMP phosphodiesterase class II)